MENMFYISGYGNISPTNTFGRMFMILYALIGIPVNGILFAYLGEFFGSTVIVVALNQFCFLEVFRHFKEEKLSRLF